MAEEEGHQVKLHVYDLSQGLARQLSTSFLGKAIEAIWHTGIVAYGNEYYFGGGIQRAPIGTTPYGTPMRVVDLGVTHLSKEDFEMYLEEISPRYTAETYSLLSHNCNNFSNEVAEFLVGVTIPDYILQLPNEVMSSPMGALILPMIQQLETTLRAGAVPQAPQFRPSSATVSANINKSSGGSISPSPLVTSKASEVVKSSEQQTQSSTVSQEKPVVNGAKTDSLGDARSRVQEEIGREFTTIMATGTLHASEAAALATRRVMQRYGRLNVSSPRG